MLLIAFGVVLLVPRLQTLSPPHEPMSDSGNTARAYDRRGLMDNFSSLCDRYRLSPCVGRLWCCHHARKSGKSLPKSSS